MKLTKEILIDWIDRPPSNSDLDLINYIIGLQNIKDNAINYNEHLIEHAKYHLNLGHLKKMRKILKGDSDE